MATGQAGSVALRGVLHQVLDRHVNMLSHAVHAAVMV